MICAALGELNYEKYRLSDNGVFIRQAADELIRRHHCDPDFTPDTIARLLHVSRRQLYRHFEQEPQSMAELIGAQRARTARSLIVTNPTRPAEEIATESGFTSTATMRSHLRAQYGMGPKEIRSSATEAPPTT